MVREIKKFCRDCKYYTHSFLFNGKCLHSESQRGQNQVTGEIHYHYCNDMRDWRCKNGKLFEEDKIGKAAMLVGGAAILVGILITISLCWSYS